jgi:hypothetical protein
MNVRSSFTLIAPSLVDGMATSRPAAQAEREKQMQLVSQGTSKDDAYADLNKQRGLDSIDEKYSVQMGQAADFYSRVFEYDPRNKTVHTALAAIYMEMWRAAQRRNKPELM